MARETEFQSQVESYQRLKKWYLIQPFLTYHIYPTPPLGQDMTQGQFLSGV